MHIRSVDRKFVRRRETRLLIAVVVAIAALLWKDVSLDARKALFGQRPIQMYVPYAGTAPVSLPPVLLIAHNAGNDEVSTRRASSHAAAGIEVDVRLVAGVLYATHSPPSGLVPLRAWQAPRLSEAWGYTTGADVLKFDLKTTGAGTLEALVRFLDVRSTDRQIIVVGSDLEALVWLDQSLPETLQFLSIKTGIDVDELIDRGTRLDGIDGISVPHWTLTQERVIALEQLGYLIDAWTVNDFDRLIELATWGVDAMTTDNLAFFDLAATPE